jgi:cytochrome c-type biogenesis protein CcmF
MYFLSVVLIGTIYPIFLEVLINEKISIGPPFFNKLLIPFLAVFLIFMSIGPKLNWIKDNFEKIKYLRIILFFICIILSFYLIKKTSSEILFTSVIGGGALYLLFISIEDLFKKKYNISQVISHFGFSLFILSILFNSLFSTEFSANMKVGQELSFKKDQVKFLKIKIFEKENYKSVIANFEIIDEKENVISLYPEIRIYNQPNILTSEADIISSVFSDKFMVINLLKGEEIFNVRYQTKPFMIWIWISTFLISFGGILGLLKRN